MKRFTLIILISVFSLSACKELEKLTGQFVEYASPPAETNSKPSDPARVLPPNPKGCPEWDKNTTVDITQSITLASGCKYDRVNFVINNQSNIVFDCNGAEFNGLDKEYRQGIDVSYSSESAPLDYGIRVISGESANSRNITIKNCNLTNFVRGIIVSLGRSESSQYDLKNNINIEALEDYLRSVSPKNIRIENSTINYSHKDGVFVGRYVTDFVLENSSINYTGAVGLYLDSGSQKNTIQNSTFSNNGYSDYDSSKRIRKKKLANDSREAIAIDSSAYNTIQKNAFSKNSGGAIFLYKNCNEHYQDPNQIPRYQSSDYNTITNNQFKNESTGVWIASRQSKDLNALECGSPIVHEGVVRYGPVEEDAKYYEDFAKHNEVTNNLFDNVNKGVFVEDDYNSITGNTFTGSASYNVQVGTQFRTRLLSHPVTGTLIKNNTFNTSTDTPIRLIFDPVDTTITGNIPDDINPD